VVFVDLGGGRGGGRSSTHAAVVADRGSGAGGVGGDRLRRAARLTSSPA